jgi:phage tail sheath protein FI
MKKTTKRFEFMEPEKGTILTDALIIVDKKTGVNYLMVRSGYGAGLTPLIDADGKPIVTK